MKDEHKTPDYLKAIRVAQKRLTWIDNVKRKLGYTQEQAEKAWETIHNTKLHNPNSIA